MIDYLVVLVLGVVLGWFIGPYFDRVTDWRKKKIKKE